MMLIVGLTGGIGSGKTTAADLFAQLGVPVLDADDWTRSLLSKDKKIIDTICQHFGEKVRDPKSGGVDRPALRAIIFDHAKARAWLENLLHPPILTAMLDAVKKLKGHYCIAVVPLLVETHSDKLFHRICVVDIPEQEQVNRTVMREGFSPEFVEKIMRSQATREERLAAADDILYNDGTVEDLKEQVVKLHAHYFALSSGAGKGQPQKVL